jgi:alanine racemase
MTSSALQLERFQEVLRFYEKRSLPTPMRHVCNSGGIVNLPEAHLDMVRPGVLFYGIYPGREMERKVNVKTAATWKSKVAYSKVTQPGRSVSYGSLWQVEGSPTRIVTIPCGYADGYFRRMTNQRGSSSMEKNIRRWGAFAWTSSWSMWATMMCRWGMRCCCLAKASAPKIWRIGRARTSTK